MELLLAHQAGTQVSVTCDGQLSHTFDLRTLAPNKEKGVPQPLEDPVTYGRAVYQALFPPGAAAARTLNEECKKMPGRVLLVTADNDIDAVPWEYAYGPDGFLVLECHVVRGLPAEQRIPPPTLDRDLHIVAVPSNPLDKDVPALDIEGEWMRLQASVQQVPYAVTLERTRPPTIEQTRALLANQRQRILHFMGHGGQQKDFGTFLCFEKEHGDLDAVTAKQLVLRARGTVFLVTLNACVSATPGPTLFSNLAAALVRQQVPYALGMRFSIRDDDARAFSRTFYNELARGSPVEEALLQARLTLASSPRSWVVGVPVLYTSLAYPAAGFTSTAGTPTVNEHQPPMEITVLPRAEGAFQGRIDELKALGKHLTGDGRPRLVTMHGGGGQGKTTLAREAVERFSHAWPGGVWATSLENLPERATFVADLARFLGIATQEIADPAEVERRVHTRLMQHRTLLVLDNAETLVDAVESNDAAALHLVEFIRQLPGPSVSLLVTSRVQLGWSGEVSYEVGGLSSEEGADLFRQSAPQRTDEIAPAVAQEISKKLEGHPFSLRLLGGAFNASAISLHTFVEDSDAQLMKAENKYVGEEHRHRKLYTCIETSVRYLDADLCALLSGLWVFRAPFLPDTAVTIFDHEHEDSEEHPSPIRNRLHTLWQRGLLARETATVRDGTVQFYHVLPTTRPYVEHHLEQAYEHEKLLTQFGAAYSYLSDILYRGLDRSAAAVTVAQQAREDLEQGIAYVTGVARGHYLWHCGWILHRLGYPLRGLALLELALEIAQGPDQSLEGSVLNNMALVYQDTGKPKEALALYQQALAITREVGDRDGEATTLNNMAGVYQATGMPQEALKLNERVLPIWREIGDRAGEATTLNNMAEVYRATGKPKEALKLYEQALPITQEVGHRLGEATTLNNIAEVYRTMGRPQEALKLNEQALPIMREVGNRAGEATTLNNMAEVYRTMGRPQEALKLNEQALAITREVSHRSGEAHVLNNMAGVYQAMGKRQEELALYEQALPIRQEVGDRSGEATTLNNMAGVYRATGRPQEALKLYEQALPIRQEVGDRLGEAITLNNMADVYRATGRPQEALSFYEQVLPIRREVGDRAGEAAALNNMADVYRATGQQQEALSFYEQVLPIRREVGDRAGEAAALNNLALVYDATGKPEQALRLYEQALPIRREVGDRAGEATTLNGLAYLLQNMYRYAEALTAFEQSIALERSVSHVAGEVAGLVGMALLLYRHLNRTEEAITQIEQAIAVLVNTGLPQDAAGQTLTDLRRVLQTMRTGGSPGPQSIGVSDEVVQAVQDFVNAEDWEATRQVVEAQQALLFQPEVETIFEANIAHAKSAGNQRAVDMLEMHLALLRACKADGIAPTFEKLAVAREDVLPFDEALITSSIRALSGSPQEKMEQMQYLATQLAQTTDEGLKALIKTIQLALFSSDLFQLGQDLSGVYRQAWEIIVEAVKKDGELS